MKTIIINGSPRPDGNTVILINMLKEKLLGETEVVNVYDLKFSACIDCRECVRGDCIYSDDASRLIDKIDDNDNIVIATPLYYNQPTGMLMSLMSRNQVIFNGKREMKPKKGAIIVTGGGETIINSADCEKTLRIVLKSYNADTVAYARSLITDRVPSDKDERAKADIVNMARVLNKN